jgi:uncharacterized protein (DUF488 family)
MGFTKKEAPEFFRIIGSRDIKLLLDIRLENNSQLAGFTKRVDLEYFLNKLCQCRYGHRDDLAPTKEMLRGYKKKELSWHEYEKQYISLIKNRGSINSFVEQYCHCEKICLLCSEPTPEYCHRRLLAEMIMEKYPQVSVEHI